MPTKAKERDTNISLSQKEMKRMAKPKPGFASFASLLLGMVEDGRLPKQILDVDEVRAHLAAFAAAQDRVYRAQIELRIARATRFWHASHAWKSLLEIYDYARLASRRSSSVRISLRPFVQFMRRGRKRKAKSRKPAP
jgi:hypothetical protein